MENEDLHYVTSTKAWIESFVIALNLCPFAKGPTDAGQVRFIVSHTSDLEKILLQFWEAIEFMERHSAKEVSNSFLIIPFAPKDFQDFLNITDLAEGLLIDQKKIDDYQLVSFHPEFHFVDSKIGEPGNKVNQSPYPMIHILREKEVRDAIVAFGDTSQIPQRNRNLMEEMYEKSI